MAVLHRPNLASVLGNHQKEENVLMAVLTALENSTQSRLWSQGEKAHGSGPGKEASAPSLLNTGRCPVGCLRFSTA